MLNMSQKRQSSLGASLQNAVILLLVGGNSYLVV